MNTECNLLMPVGHHHIHPHTAPQNTITQQAIGLRIISILFNEFAWYPHDNEMISYVSRMQSTLGIGIHIYERNAI